MAFLIFARRVAQSDRDFPQLPLLAAGVHPQGDGCTGAEAREQQLIRRRTRIAAAPRDRLIGRQPVMAGRDLLSKVKFAGNRNMSHCLSLQAIAASS